MSGFELQISDVGTDRSANCATTTAPLRRQSYQATNLCLCLNEFDETRFDFKTVLQLFFHQPLMSCEKNLSFYDRINQFDRHVANFFFDHISMQNLKLR